VEDGGSQAHRKCVNVWHILGYQLSELSFRCCIVVLLEGVCLVALLLIDLSIGERRGCHEKKTLTEGEAIVGSDEGLKPKA